MVKFRMVLPVLAGCILELILLFYKASFPIIQTNYFKESIRNVIFLMSTILSGKIFGSFLFCFLSEIIGQKNTLTGTTLPFIISCGLFQFFEGYVVRYIAAALLGIALGGVHTVLPIYISEISEKYSRGMYVSMLNIFPFLPYFLVEYISSSKNIKIVYTVLNYGCIVFGFVIGLLFDLGSESPLYYLRQHKEGKAYTTLNKLRNIQEAQSEMYELKSLIVNHTYQYRSGNDKIMPCFKSNGSVKAVIMMLMLIILRTFCGIQAAPFYTNILLGRASSRVIIITSILTVLSALACVFIVDRIGRKKCLILSFGGMAISLIYLCIINILKRKDIIGYHNFSYLFNPFMFIFNSSFCFGAGPIPYVLIGEIFPPKIRMLMSALLTASLGILQSLGLNINIAIYSFDLSLYINIVTCVLAVIVVQFLFLETARKSLHEIQIDLKRY